MNNQMPYFPNDNQGIHNDFTPNMGNGYHHIANNNIMLERLNNRINRMERQIRIIENRLNRLENVNPTFLNTNDAQNDDNMYIL